MKSLFLKNEFPYDGTQLRPLYAYLEHGVLGDSIVAWVGPCEIPFEHMVDGEDLREASPIRGGRMLHFIIEIFDRDLFSAVALQRLFASLWLDEMRARASASMASAGGWRRDGDDVYFDDKKLSISIASRSSLSCQIHFAVNVTNQGTPVPTCALEDFQLKAEPTATKMMELFIREYESTLQATRKVREL